MLRFRQCRFNSLFLSDLKSFGKNGAFFARYSTENSDRNTRDEKRDEGDETGHGGRKILKKVAKALSDVPTKIQANTSNLTDVSMQKISGSLSALDDVLGISAVRDAQQRVREAEDLFMNLRKYVQDSEKELESVRTKLNEVRKRLDRVSRDDEQYLSLATEEHTILLEEKGVKAALRDYEIKERDQFAMLSGIVRESHEKERERVERTKYWSMAGSVIGAAIGVIGSTVINYVRLKEVKSSVKSTGEELMERSSEILSLVTTQDSKLASDRKEIKDVLQATCEDMTTKLAELKDSIDTYTLSATIGSDVGTVEAGISLKSLTAQLTELVQLQLAKHREQLDEDPEQADIPNMIKNQINNLKEENRSNFADVFVDLNHLSKKIDSNRSQEIQEPFTREQSYDEAALVSKIEEYDQRLQEAHFWSKVQIVTSAASVFATIALIAYDFTK